jgi:hypothetical protein
MPYKRIVRVILFVLLNFSIFIGSLFLYIMNMDDDDCDSCYAFVRSGTPTVAKKNGTLISSFHIINSEFSHGNVTLKDSAVKTKFWVENVKIVARNSTEEYRDTFLVWNNTMVPRVEFHWLTSDTAEKHGNSFGYFKVRKKIPDTIILGVFQIEPVAQGRFVYVKRGKT